MPLYKFKPNDIFHNTIKTHPKCEFFITEGNIYYNNRKAVTGSHVANTGDIPVGHISLHEINVDRAGSLEDAEAADPGEYYSSVIYPFVTKDGSQSGFKSTSTSGFNSGFDYGDKMVGTYPLSASISIDIHDPPRTPAVPRPMIVALRNTLNYYKATLSPYYDYSYYAAVNEDPDSPVNPALNIISIPSIFYGSSIKKGTVDLRFYISGTLHGQLKDEKQDGELIQVGPVGSPGSGSVAGIVLYNEGFFILTGSVDLDGSGALTEKYTGTHLQTPMWRYFGATGSSGVQAVSSSFGISFQGTNYVPTLTMFAHANRNELNHSNNPTFLDYDHTGSHVPLTGAAQFVERKDIPIRNTVKTSWVEPTGSFKKTTYISKIALYDEKKNLIGIAKVATPVKKTEDRDFTFKLKLDF
ncbi:MAG TPA: hypothetical protein EYN38_08815 [Flavobacteriales bacterium]|nr:hypothetical protein [Flavobacteriales bacterium]